MICEGKKLYSPEEALQLVLDCASAKFVESVDVNVLTGADSTNPARGLVRLPCGNGRKVVIAVFAEGDDAKQARDSGADIVGLEDLISKVSAGDFAFDICLATPNILPQLTKIAKILGPKGLMPSVKSGTVSDNLPKSVQDFKKGQVQFRSDKYGTVHVKLGNTKFSVADLTNNLLALLSAVMQLKPSDFKKQYIKDIYLSSTMGNSYKLDCGSLLRRGLSVES